MHQGKFLKVATQEGNPNWENAIKRQKEIYSRRNDIRSEFFRDYTRILHSNAYRRLKHKTQVFFATDNDHICTRIEHVNHVAAISYIIAKQLGLNTELTNAIATGHDLGHAPFGHCGEEILEKITKVNGLDRFWHEKNSLKFIDKIETLPDNHGYENNLNLTYAVRDGIISHCGEVDEEKIIPRTEAIDLYEIEPSNRPQPYTWEGCVVKVSDKIAYLGRDIEDALSYKILSPSHMTELTAITAKHLNEPGITEINNTILIHYFITDLCSHSNPEEGIKFSEPFLNLINEIKDFNYKYIYEHPRLKQYTDFSDLVVKAIFTTLKQFYVEGKIIETLEKNKEIYPILNQTFIGWLNKYSNLNTREATDCRYKNDIIFEVSTYNGYLQSIIDFISGMTDRFAIKVFDEITTFK